jgi:hypothetical protein
MQPLTPGTKIRIAQSYCLRKRHGQEFVIVEPRELYGKLYYSLVGQDWLVCSEDVELCSNTVIESNADGNEDHATSV